MHDRTSTILRPRVRRGLGVAVGLALMVSPLALAPAASAQSGGALGGTDTLLQGLLEGLLGGNTVGNLLGGGSSEQSTCYTPDGLGATLSCVVVPLDNALNPSRKAKLKVAASRKNARVHISR